MDGGLGHNGDLFFDALRRCGQGVVLAAMRASQMKVSSVLRRGERCYHTVAARCGAPGKRFRGHPRDRGCFEGDQRLG